MANETDTYKKTIPGKDRCRMAAATVEGFANGVKNLNGSKAIRICLFMP